MAGIALGIAFILIVSADCRAQSNGTVWGRASDPRGGTIGRALITLRNPGTGVEPTVETDNEGLYQIAGLAAGSYQLVQSGTNPGTLANNYTRVTVAGSFFSQSRISVDGSTINDRFVGDTRQNFSQESVQEFQISTFDFDPSSDTPGARVGQVFRTGGPRAFQLGERLEF